MEARADAGRGTGRRARGAAAAAPRASVERPSRAAPGVDGRRRALLVLAVVAGRDADARARKPAPGVGRGQALLASPGTLAPAGRDTPATPVSTEAPAATASPSPPPTPVPVVPPPRAQADADAGAGAGATPSTAALSIAVSDTTPSPGQWMLVVGRGFDPSQQYVIDLLQGSRSWQVQGTASPRGDGDFASPVADPAVRRPRGGVAAGLRLPGEPRAHQSVRPGSGHRSLIAPPIAG